MKRQIERSPLRDGESYLQRITSAVNSISVSNCEGYIRHMKTFWRAMLRREDL